MRPLTENQLAVLRGLRLHGGFWHANCGWHWDTPSATVRVLTALANRGLLRTSPWYGKHLLYEIEDSATFTQEA